MKSAPRAVLLTGGRGIGKTTLCMSLAQNSHAFSGLASPSRVDQQGRKIGFQGLCLETGERWELARSDISLGGPMMGKYSFSAEGIERAVRCIARALDGTKKTVVVDEIGPLEIDKGMGYAPILPLLARARDLLLVVRAELVSRLAECVPDHRCQVFTLTLETRDALGSRIQKFLEA